MAARRASLALILASVLILSACATTSQIQPSGGTIECSPEALIAAIQAANTTKEQVSINLVPDCLYSFTDPYEGEFSYPFTALPSIASPIVIHGNGAKLQVTNVWPSYVRLLHVGSSGGQLTLNNLVLRARQLDYSCGVEGYGGLILNEGTLFANDSDFKDGMALRGSAIATTGHLQVAGSTFENSVEYTDVCIGEGGAIHNTRGSLVVDSSIFSGIAAAGFGGAIYSDHVLEGMALISNSQFINNSSRDEGGAIYVKGDLTITGSAFESNSSDTAGGALYHHHGNLEISSSSFITNTANAGGAILHRGVVEYLGPGTSLSITACDFIMNQAVDNGAALHISLTDPESEIVLKNNTISQNTGLNAIFNQGPLLLQYNTIAFNSGSGIFSTPPMASLVTIEDSIIANNFQDCQIPYNLIPTGSNLDSDGSCTGFSMTADPQLEPLANHGGSTLTHALPANSPAVDAATGDCPATDQRGEARPGGGACDLGAYESGMAAVGDPAIGELPGLATSEPPDKEGPGPIPDLEICVARVTMLVPCNEGPGDAYPTVNALRPEGVVEVTGQSVNGDYAVVRNPCFPELGCWVRKTTLVFLCDDEALPLISTPALKQPLPDPSDGGPSCNPNAGSESECTAGGGVWQPLTAPPCQCP